MLTMSVVHAYSYPLPEYTVAGVGPRRSYLADDLAEVADEYRGPAAWMILVGVPICQTEVQLDGLIETSSASTAFWRGARVSRGGANLQLPCERVPRTVT